MTPVVWVALGGALGSVLRFKLGGWVTQSCLAWKFPLGTFTVNVVGCCVAGLLAGLAVRPGPVSEDARAFLFVGILGGFTTFSAFGLDTFSLLRKSEFLVAGGYVLLSICVSFLALWLGFSLTRGTVVPT